MRYIHTILLFLCSICTFAAEDNVPSWEVHVNDNYCNATLEMEIKRPDDPNSMFGRYIGFFLVVAIPHRGADLKYVDLIPAAERPYILVFQAFPSLMIKKDKIKIGDVYVKTKDKEYNLVFDKDKVDPHLQTYYLLGNKGYEIWNNIINGVSVNFHYSLTENENYTISARGRHIRSIAKMFDACVKEMSHN